MNYETMKRKHSGDPPHDDDDLRPCPLPWPPDVYVCDVCCGMSKQGNKCLWIVKIPWVAPIGQRDRRRLGPWLGEPGGFGFRLVDRAELSPGFVAHNMLSPVTKYVCFLCAGTFVYGDRNHFMDHEANRGHPLASFPCCFDPNDSWKDHDQQSVVHSVPNLKQNINWKNPLCLCPECDTV